MQPVRPAGAGSAEIRAFITDNYDIDFPVFAKVDVNGDNAAELYQWLKSSSPGESSISPGTLKFLVNTAGDGGRSLRVAPEAIAEQLGELLG